MVTLASVSDEEVAHFAANLTPEQRAALAKLSPERANAAIRLTIGLRGQAETSATVTHLQSEKIGLAAFALDRFYIPETRLPMQLFPHQQAILEYFFDPALNWQTMIYSTVKKSGKTAVASLVARWVVETWGAYVEAYCLANDYEQARGRIYAKILNSIELTPGYRTQRRVLPGKWHIVEREARFLKTNSTVKAVSGDYKGEAGSNPNATFWSELWAYTSEASQRLWEELTPVPTRARSIRFVETYAGYSNESKILLDLYNHVVKNGDRLTHADIPAWPFEDRPPIYVRTDSRTVAYWDEGEIARRMPWQTPDYYAGQATLRAEAFNRLHLNQWTDSVDAFLEKQWWRSCYGPVPTLDRNTPVVLGVDLAVTSDCAAVVAVTRAPSPSPEGGEATPMKNIYLRYYRVWYPPKGGSIRLEDVKQFIKWFASEYNVVQVAYDPYQGAKLAQELTEEGVVWTRPFNQGATREVADFTLYQMIRDKRLTHACDESSEMTTHVYQAGSKMSKENDTKLRIVKKAQDQKIDLVVALSMAVSEALRLVLD